MKEQRGYGPNKRPGFRPRLEVRDAPFKIRSSYYSAAQRDPHLQETNCLVEQKKLRRGKYFNEYHHHSCPDDSRKYNSIVSRGIGKPRGDPEEMRPRAPSSRRDKEVFDRSANNLLNNSYKHLKNERVYVNNQIDRRVASRMNGNSHQGKLKLDHTKFKLSRDDPDYNPNDMDDDTFSSKRNKINNSKVNYISGDENSPKDRKSVTSTDPNFEGRTSKHSFNVDFKMSAKCLNKSYTNIKKSYTALKNTCSSLSRKPSIRSRTGSSRRGSSCGDRSNLNVSFAGNSSIEEIEIAADDDNIEEKCICCPFMKRPSFLNNIQRLLRVDSSMLGTLPDDILDCAETRRNTELNKISSETHGSLRATSSDSQGRIRRDMDSCDLSGFRGSRVSLNDAEDCVRTRNKRNLQRTKFSLATDSRVRIHKYRVRRRHKEQDSDDDSGSRRRSAGSIGRNRSCFSRRSSRSSRMLASECSSSEYDDENSITGCTEGKRNKSRSQIHNEPDSQLKENSSRSRNDSRDNINALTANLQKAVRRKMDKTKLKISAIGSKVRLGKEKEILNAEKEVEIITENDSTRFKREERLKNYIKSISGGTESKIQDEKLPKTPKSTIVGKTRPCRSRISFHIGLEGRRKSKSCTCTVKNPVSKPSKTAVSSTDEVEPNDDFEQSDQDTRSNHYTYMFSCCLNLRKKFRQMSTRDS